MCTTWQHETLLKIKKGGLLMYPINVRCSTKKNIPKSQIQMAVAKIKKIKVIRYYTMQSKIMEYFMDWNLSACFDLSINLSMVPSDVYVLCWIYIVHGWIFHFCCFCFVFHSFVVHVFSSSFFFEKKKHKKITLACTAKITSILSDLQFYRSMYICMTTW